MFALLVPFRALPFMATATPSRRVAGSRSYYAGALNFAHCSEPAATPLNDAVPAHPRPLGRQFSLHSMTLIDIHGFCADARSPIASTPQSVKKTREAASELHLATFRRNGGINERRDPCFVIQYDAGTPYMASLSPMHRQDRVRARRTNEHGASG